ncbi:LysR family transcriptional regulator [Desulfovibrio aerotolerans]|uniref:LysR family transcriptional regulator n=1 Tax=Solidesulfovibrio aerotolerans TaxID=295255 RepID=A0A7C9IL15_9BACT|nr:LysR family transcriptional regulator [Solidesulfovibrio aerotolerans]MYL82606.1 LysR family transcriptional regulator [Solidesulfovibrio aerotolerans]
MDKSPFDLQALRTLVAVADTGGFTKAAAVLHKTQAAVSVCVAMLEDGVGCRLFERSRQGCQPTPAGAVLLGHAREILQRVAAAAAAMQSARPTGRVRLGIPDDVVMGLSLQFVRRLAEDNPAVLVDLRCELSAGLETALWAGELDLAVVVREPGSQQGEFLFRDPLLWCVPPGHSPEWVRPLPVALFAAGCRTRPMVLAALDSAGINYTEVCRASHVAGLTAMAAARGAIVALARQALPRDWRFLAPGEAGLPWLPDYEAALLLPPQPTPLASLVAGLLTVAARETVGSGQPTAAVSREAGNRAATALSTTSAPG